MRKIPMALAILCTPFLFSCVSSKKLKFVKAEKDDLATQYQQLQVKQQDCEGQLSKANSQIENLNQQLSYLKENNTAALKQLQDMSVISASQAESIKKSMENIGAKDAYIQDLQKSIARKDSLNMALVMNLKGAVGDLNDKDINIKVDKGVVYIDISDKLLFNSGSYTITNQAKVVLGKVAKVLINQPAIEFMVEGHTDTNPIKNNCIQDNWDLSVKRATSVIRVLQNDYGIPPARMAASGRSEFIPIADNTTAEGRAANRRTRIVILPQLDQFFKLLETPKK
ncbi:OmpA/MotB family protein [Solitalea canadensis]|uniref:Flagellar motor protein n=1 Tax=Solitalea canadensis (strain ATCC 29591 / DSM 3403 / JCM 21819 / LMG 8368 / NBRC 15130 / NCIMB 12057 / USAM 9D) TaxID=929556 RepID=H8KXX6_SOLCM|nr:OmpA family protein [Solitalea canadensis]AFD05652.1 flagellar motor protein [Solitalea canadensis DSM 3403]